MMKPDAKTTAAEPFLPKVSLSREGKAPEEERNLQILIKPVAGRKDEYLAYCRSQFLGATFSVYFKDNLMGALALHAFAEMIRKRYEEDRVRILVSGEEMRIQNDALLELFSQSA